VTLPDSQGFGEEKQPKIRSGKFCRKRIVVDSYNRVLTS